MRIFNVSLFIKYKLYVANVVSDLHTLNDVTANENQENAPNYIYFVGFH